MFKPTLAIAFINFVMVPAKAIALIKRFEGCKLEAYLCPAGKWTIGYGSTMLGGRPVRKGDRLGSEEDALALLVHQLERDFLPKLQGIPGWAEMSENQQSALISFAWNLGAGFYGSNGFATITKYLKEKAWDVVPDALGLYVKGGGITLPGLVNRRRAEAELWKAG